MGFGIEEFETPEASLLLYPGRQKWHPVSGNGTRNPAFTCNSAGRWPGAEVASAGAVHRPSSAGRRTFVAVLPGLVRYDEVFGAGDIRHAFRVTVRATNGYVYPASHQAGSRMGALPMGARLRLKASRDISGYRLEIQKIFRAMKRYGLIVADNGSDLYVSGTYDTRWDNGVLNPAFSSLTASDFEVVQLGYRPSATPPASPVNLRVVLN